MNSTRVTICGNYGATNLGDEALLQGIINLVNSSIAHPEIAALSANPEETRALYGVEAQKLVPAGIRSWLDSLKNGSFHATKALLKKTDIFILGGGGLFTDEKIHAVFIWALQAWVAKRSGATLFCFGQSVGPLNTFLGRWITKKVFSWASMVSVRDEESKFLLERIGIPNAYALADPAFALASTTPLQEVREDYVVLSVRPWIHGDKEACYKRLAEFIDWLWESRKLRTVLVPFQISHDNDARELERIKTLVSIDASVELFDYSADFRHVLQLISRSKAVVGMRLHSLIASSLAHTPFIGLSYSDKVSRFCKELGLADFVVDWADFSLEDLQTLFEEISKDWTGVSERIDQGVMKLRKKALKHEELLRTLQMDLQAN